MKKLDVNQIREKLGIGDDKVYGVIGEFDDPHDLVHAGRKIREMGYTKLDAMSPFPVHGIDRRRGSGQIRDRRKAAVRFHVFDSDHV
jgi:hypothetical protein